MNDITTCMCENLSNTGVCQNSEEFRHIMTNIILNNEEDIPIFHENAIVEYGEEFLDDLFCNASRRLYICENPNVEEPEDCQ
jgi:hypothetical protein